jgi:UDP-N-acetylmuramate dehydrogenase
MDSLNKHALKNNNSFNLEVFCSELYVAKSIEDLIQLPDLSTINYYILGDGSNTLFVEPDSPVIIKSEIKGIKVTETSDNFIVNVGAGENWHDLVCYCVGHGINGLENLALIPGSVGAAPVQNIGAYGVEFSDFCLSVNYFDLQTRECVSLLAAQCDFGYRNSIFKKSLHNKALITDVTFSFSKIWKAKLSYNGLDKLSSNSDAKRVMTEVIRLRNSKLPNPAVLPNAGSFFKNPIVSGQQFNLIKSSFPNIPNYKQEDGKIKLAAGWLIEQSGLKGFNYKNVGVDKRQALVLVNYGNSSGRDLIDLAKYVQQKVMDKFSVSINPEVRLISTTGEVDFNSLLSGALVSRYE